ncbi:DNA polymerase V [Pedobacter sp. CG_S7]|uniref:LexA family protein n=1 Tax=Pedobacter sp. CG_S7 TaxID=3143930 RepID=UPI0033954C45
MLREIDFNRDIDKEPLANPSAVSGFVSPADDYMERRLHIAQKIVDDPVNTFYFEVQDNQMSDYGILKGTILVVDRSKDIQDGSIIVCNVDGEWLNRCIVHKNKERILFTSPNDNSPLNVTGKNMVIFGVVSWYCVPYKSYVRFS